MDRQDLSDKARKVREIEVQTLLGMTIDDALQAARVSEADYLAWRAELAGVGVDRVAEMHRAHREHERGIHPPDYVGRLVPGVCPVCGTDEGFENYTENLRESGTCRSCGASERQRHMAFMVRQRLGLGFDGPLRLPHGMAAHNTESSGAVHHRLLEAPGYTFSEYWGPDHRSGDIVDGVRHEDLQALSFSDESLDLVLSSDVLEHMPDPYRAHAEIFRVLRPGGTHIFTVPFNHRRQDDVLARIEDGEIHYFGEKFYHGDPVRPDEGILVWTVFGSEMLDRLQEIGFQPLTWRFSSPRQGILDAIVFEALKPLTLSSAWLEHLQRATADRHALHVKLQAQRAALADRDQRLASQDERIRAMEGSMSWRLTAPLRAIRSLF